MKNNKAVFASEAKQARCFPTTRLLRQNGVPRNDILQAMKKYSIFCQKVWRACAQIPRGQTRTYGELAKKIGHPGAARAVGQALAANPFAPTIPCHRVIGSSGALVGYSAPGGVQKKRLLLQRESA